MFDVCLLHPWAAARCFLYLSLPSPIPDPMPGIEWALIFSNKCRKFWSFLMHISISRALISLASKELVSPNNAQIYLITEHAWKDCQCSKEHGLGNSRDWSLNYLSIINWSEVEFRSVQWCFLFKGLEVPMRILSPFGHYLTWASQEQGWGGRWQQ